MLVVDASAVVELLLGRPAARRIAGLVADHRYDLHAPQLLDVEVVSALRRVLASGDTTEQRAGEAVIDFLDLPIDRYSHAVLVPRIWQLRENFGACDATYLALAEALSEDGAQLLTCDARFARGVRTHSAVAVLPLR